jgi:tRNA threonylcarbamoyladenosine biosynthesis protein TsaB
MVYRKQTGTVKLAIETATEVCSVALELADSSIVEKRQAGKGIHSEKLFQFIEQLFNENNLEPGMIHEVLISKGPGQYTGLRIGAAGVKGLLMKKETELYTIGTLEGFAAAFSKEISVDSDIHAVIDARREHLYYQSFRFSKDKIQSTDASVLEIDTINQMIKPGDLVIGTGLERLETSPEADISFFDYNKISAVNLIYARNDSRFKGYFSHTDPSEFEPAYLSTRQVNNTVIGK